MRNMINGLKTENLLIGFGFFAVTITAFVVLVTNGYSGDAAGVVVFAGPFIGLMLGQQAIHKTAQETSDKVSKVLNGGTESAIRKVMREELPAVVDPDVVAGRDGQGSPGTVQPANPAGQLRRRAPRSPR